MAARFHAALTASVSLIAIAGSTAAMAANSGGVRQQDSGADAINIYELAAADPPAEFGAVDSAVNPGGAATATAIVSCAESGTCANFGAIEQSAVGVASARNLIDIDGNQDLIAIALASGSVAFASATIDTAVWQFASASGAASNALSVDGVLDLSGAAHAYASDGKASAFAIFHDGIVQSAIGATAIADLIVVGELGITASAEASGTSALAAARLDRGLVQDVSGTHAYASVDNDGTLEIAALALADGGHAHAAAGISTAIAQSANGAEAAVEVSNSGTLLIGADALAYASGDGSGFDALAQASVLAGIDQVAAGGEASARVSNADGGLIAIDIAAKAVASDEDGDAISYAQLGVAAIHQDVEGVKGGGEAAITNAGTIMISLDAFASGGGDAQATANASGILWQDVAGNGVASAGLDNDGLIDIDLSADATGGDGAVAVARLNFLLQDVSAGSFGSSSGHAVASFANAGTIDIGLVADASGVADAGAAALIGLGLVQQAYATLVDIGIDNGGELVFSVGAVAVAQSGPAGAVAGIERGILQIARPLGDDAEANIDLANAGLIAMSAIAHAAGTAASALATIDHVISQVVEGSGDALGSVSIDNGGVIAVTLSAAATGSASAYASANFGAGFIFGLTAAMFQLVEAEAGGAAAFANSGTIDIDGHAEAAANSDSGYAFASVLGFGGLTQIVIAVSEATTTGIVTVDGGIRAIATQIRSGPASAIVTNSGVIDVGVSARAVAGGRAEAVASLANGIVQIADGSSVEVAFSNVGTIAFHATATATGGGPVQALANVAAIDQIAFSLNGSLVVTQTNGGGTISSFRTEPAGPASVAFFNVGDIVIEANAHAVGGSLSTGSVPLSAVAFAFADRLFQRAVGVDATASIHNEGTIVIAAFGEAEGPATARVLTTGGLVRQFATDLAFEHRLESYSASGLVTGDSQPAGLAHVEIVNDGVMVLDLAAIAEGGARATAGIIGTGATQTALGATAEALFVNSGTFALQASAIAAGSTAYASAYLGGIDQNASAVHDHFTQTYRVISTGTVSGFPTSLVTTSFVSSSALEGKAAVAFVNDGIFDIRAVADVEAGAFGSAVIVDTFLIRQFAAADTAEAVIDNSGTMHLVAIADAVATGAAIAVVNMPAPNVQIADAGTEGGVASVAIENAGEISIAALAGGDGGTLAIARAFVGSQDSGAAFVQQAAGYDSAVAELVNSGEIAIVAVADAAAVSGSAQASATIHAAFRQNVSAQSFATTSASVSGAFVGNLSITPVGTAVAAFDNDGAISIAAAASASGVATAQAYGFIPIGLSQEANGLNASVAVDNSGTFEVIGTARASAANGAIAAALVNGVDQRAVAFATSAQTMSGSATYSRTFHGTAVGTARASMVNSGTIHLAASAQAYGSQTGGTLTEYLVAPQAIIDGVHQFAVGADAGALFDNQGTYSIEAMASAEGDRAAAAVGIIGVVDQTVSAVSVTAMSRSSSMGGTISFTDHAIGTAQASLVNSGAISVLGVARAAGNAAFGIATASGLGQSVSGAIARGEILNDGDIEILLGASAAGASVALASVLAEGFEQDVVAADHLFHIGLGSGYGSGSLSVATTPVGEARASIENSGDILISVAAEASVSVAATGTSALTSAIAGAIAIGVDQVVVGIDAAALVSNSGSIEIVAQASAEGVGFAAANLRAAGIIQTVLAAAEAHASIAGASGTRTFANSTDPLGPALAAFDNSGSLTVAAAGSALAEGLASALAVVTGVSQSAIGTSVNLIVSNSGSVSVIGDVEAAGDLAFATARVAGVGQVAMAVASHDTRIFTPTPSGYSITTDIGSTFVGPAMASFVNSGTFEVAAFASASGAAFASARAEAVGVSQVVSGASETLIFDNAGVMRVFASANASASSSSLAAASALAIGYTGAAAGGGTLVGTITNRGTIVVSAAVSPGGNAEAVGLRVSGPGDGGLTITNDGGTIVVRESVDGGASWRRGMAIDVAAAPGASVINLLGDGAIYGDIAVQSGDAINVADGTTYFDGIINPTFAVVGSLSISDGGNLILADPRLTGDPAMYDGPAYAFVDTLSVAADGTLTFELQSEGGGAQPVGSYGQVFANSASLDGTLAVLLSAPGGLFADSYSYDNVIDAGVRSGEFDQCVIAGVYAGSLFLGIDCDYDNAANVDLRLTRTPFNLVPGLNQNGTSVGEGLECIYDVTLTGGIADMLADLFLFTDPVNYNIALNQLSGSVYANYLQSFPSLGVHYNDILAKATDCEVPALAGSVLECRASSPIHLWGQADYQWRKADGDIEAGTAKSKRVSAVVGLDVTVGGAGIVGGSIGYVTNHVRDNQFGDNADADGLQVGAYGVYDPGTFYVKAMTTYSWYNGDSSRNINFAGLAPGANFAASPSGDPDVNMWTFGLHGGMRIGMGGNSVLTPYLNYDYVNAKLKSFTETGGNGADLSVYGGKAKHSFLTGGVKWATQMGGVVPEVNLGYRYRFGDKRSDFNAAFLNDRDCDFDIISAAQKKGTFLAGVSVGGKMGPVDLRIGYEGEYNSDITSHAANFKFVLPLGGRAAPPPPPPVIAPPPPPPATQTCPDGSVILATETCPAPPPPPPPPPPAPERGN